MPSAPIYPTTSPQIPPVSSPLPPLLQTPSGLALLEIQGTLNSTLAPSANGSLEVGSLSFPLYDPDSPPEDTAWHKKVWLYVGKNQRMTGEVKKLAKPLAMLRRRDASGGMVQEEGVGEEVEVVEIVRWKVLFTQRPEPMGAGGGT
nr:hypothetical protein B0A51_04143 [Rachicladosporium sp. CCFEE 5018]